MRLDAITRGTLVEWWHMEVETRRRSYKTGKDYLDALAAVFGHALDLDLIDASPIDTFRGTLRRRNRTKRGRARRVALSRLAPRALHGVRAAPGRSRRAARVWPRILRRAKVSHATPKDLRDSFASYLLTVGVQLGYVSRQLGHSDVATTARHYARWAGGDAYRAPLDLEEGEVPADLLARLEVWAEEEGYRAQLGLQSRSTSQKPEML